MKYTFLLATFPTILNYNKTIGVLLLMRIVEELIMQSSEKGIAFHYSTASVCISCLSKILALQHWRIKVCSTETGTTRNS